mgnify:FL=1
MNKFAIILSGLAILLSACSTHRTNTTQYNLLIGEWQQLNVSLKIEANGKYHYKYSADGYTNKQSSRYYADKDSVVLYGFYPDAYTPESKNEHWTIRKLTPDSLVVYVHKNTLVLDGDTLNTSGNEIETFVRRK